MYKVMFICNSHYQDERLREARKVVKDKIKADSYMSMDSDLIVSLLDSAKFKVNKLYIDKLVQLNEEDVVRLLYPICDFMECVDIDKIIDGGENNKMISIENMLYVIENLDQFGYNDLKYLGFDDVQIDKLEDFYTKINNQPTMIIQDSGVELTNFKLADIKITREI